MAPASTPAGKFSPSGIQIGNTTMAEPMFRLVNGLKQAGTSGVFYVGSSTSGSFNPATGGWEGFTPILYDGNGDRLTLSCVTNTPSPTGISSTYTPPVYDEFSQALVTQAYVTTSFSSYTCLYHFNYTIQPKTWDDNLDAMRYMKVDIWSNSSTFYKTIYVVVPDRAYGSTTTVNTAANSVSGQFSFSVPSTTPGYVFPGYLRCSLYNVNGVSGSRDFNLGGSTAFGSAYTASNTTLGGVAVVPPTVPTASTGGGTGGGTCPAPWVPIRIVDRADPTKQMDVRADELSVTDKVVSRPDPDLEGASSKYSSYAVTAVTSHIGLLWNLTLQDGRQISFSENHRLWTGTAWKKVQEFQVGDTLDGPQPGVVSDINQNNTFLVYRISIDPACQTYVTNGILSHNVKLLQ